MFAKWPDLLEVALSRNDTKPSGLRTGQGERLRRYSAGWCFGATERVACTLRWLPARRETCAVLKKCAAALGHRIHVVGASEKESAAEDSSPTFSMSDPAPNNSGREALRGAEVHMVDLTLEFFPPQVLAGWLTAPLMLAANKGDRDLARRLVDAGAEIGTALHEGAGGGHGEIVSDLMERGASMAARDPEGRTPLHVAAIRGETEVVQLFLEKGADKDALDEDQRTPLSLAVSVGQLATTRALLAAGVDISLRYTSMETSVMHMAVDGGDVEILKALIEHGADVCAVDADQDTALHHAACLDETEVVRMLVEAGAALEARNLDGCTPLHYAASNVNRDALSCLLKRGAAVNTQDESLKTPLMAAATRAGTKGAAEVVDSLLRAGAVETIVDSDGNKAADVIGEDVKEERRVADDLERVRKLLANAPADRVWRRRGYLVLCRAHLDRLQQEHVIGGTHHADTAQRTERRARLATAGGDAGGSTVDESTGSDWTVAVAKVLRLQEEDVFQTIVGYL